MMDKELLKQVQKIFKDAKIYDKTIVIPVKTTVDGRDKFHIRIVESLYVIYGINIYSGGFCFIAKSKDKNKILKVLQAIADCNN